MKIIEQNPFRTLGVYSNASAREITAHLSRAKALANVNKPAEFEEDINSILPPIKRDSASIQEATNKINLIEDKIKHALFWFCKVTSIDEIALGHLKVGNVNKALELFGKQSNFSSLINQGILLLLEKTREVNGICSILNVIHDDIYRTAFCKAICGDTIQIDADSLSKTFIDELLQEFSPKALLSITQTIDNTSKECEYLKEKVIGIPIAKINKAIKQARTVDNSNATANYQAGTTLIKNTKKDLKEIQCFLSPTDVQYQRVADNLAKAILQCGINYFNHSNDADSIDKALDIQKYALQIAVGNLTRERCQENVDILNKQKRQRDATSSIKTDIVFITDALKAFQSQSKSINNAKSLVNTCKPHLQNIKNTLGANDDFYLQISSAIANNALGMCIDVVNHAQQPPITSPTTLQSIISNALSAMNLIGSLDMISQERNRFKTNLSTLQNLKTQIDLAILQIPSTPPKSESDFNWGSLIYGIIIVIFIILVLSGC